MATAPSRVPCLQVRQAHMQNSLPVRTDMQCQDLSHVVPVINIVWYCITDEPLRLHVAACCMAILMYGMHYLDSDLCLVTPTQQICALLEVTHVSPCIHKDNNNAAH